MSPGRAHFPCSYFETLLLSRQEGRTNTGGVVDMGNMKSLTWRKGVRGERERGISCVNKLAILKSRVTFNSEVICSARASAVESHNRRAYFSSRSEQQYCYSRGAELNLTGDLVFSIPYRQIP
jgi:hypothetical protein